MEQRRKWRRFGWEKTAFFLFLAAMAVYYGWRMFALTPWYDELYTYYYFISRGPIYAAIHWPLPNNHIGYSVLSACLGVFGSSAVALRGVSYLCSLGSLIYLFRIGREWFGRRAAWMPVFLYTGMYMVNQLAVQGRGYALVSFCYLLAISRLQRITSMKEKGLGDYIVFGGSLVMALYAIPSSVYMVVPLCLAGGIALLARRENKRLMCLVVTSFISAGCTVGLYGLVWLAIGSNLLVKTEGSIYYGMGHGTVILHAPLKALGTGIDYMLATPYIQSVGREGFLGKFGQWLISLLNEYYSGGAVILAAFVIASVILSMALAVKKYSDMRGKRKNSAWEHKYNSTCISMRGATEDNVCNKCDDGIFREVYLSVTIICILLMLFIQCSLPYYRVFSFAGVTVSFAFTWLLYMAAESIQAVGGLQAGKVLAAGSVFAGAACVCLLCSSPYRAQYGGREAAIEDACRHVELSQDKKIGVTDCDQEYLLLFLYGMGEERITKSLDEAQVVLADKYLLLDYDTDVTDWSGDNWKMYFSPEEFEASGVTEDMKAVYENDRFVVYMREED